MGLYQSKPVVVDARQIPEYTKATSDVARQYAERATSFADIAEWCDGRAYLGYGMFAPNHHYPGDPGYPHLMVPTMAGDYIACPGDWLVKEGNRYGVVIYKADEFEKLFAPRVEATD